MCPPSINNLKTWLNQAGWEIIGEFNLLEKYQRWYSHFLQKLDESHSRLLLEFEDEAINRVKDTFQAILNKINSKIWNGGLIYAQFKKHLFFENKPTDSHAHEEIKLYAKQHLGTN